MHMDAHRRIKVASQIDGFLKRISRINVRGLGLRVWGFRVGGVFILGFFFGGDLFFWSGCARGLWAFGSLRLLGFLGFLLSRFLGFLAPRLLVTSWLGV